MNKKSSMIFAIVSMSLTSLALTLICFFGAGIFIKTNLWWLGILLIPIGAFYALIFSISTSRSNKNE